MLNVAPKNNKYCVSQWIKNHAHFLTPAHEKKTRQMMKPLKLKKVKHYETKTPQRYTKPAHSHPQPLSQRGIRRSWKSKGDITELITTQEKQSCLHQEEKHLTERVSYAPAGIYLGCAATSSASKREMAGFYLIVQQSQEAKCKFIPKVFRRLRRAE